MIFIRCTVYKPIMAQNHPLYGYYSSFHEGTPGCNVSIYRTPSGREERITGTGYTEKPEYSNYNHIHTRVVGIITKGWKLIREFKTPEPRDPEYLLDPEEEQWAA